MNNLKLLSALFKVQQEMQPVIKGNRNPFFKSNYADLNTLREELMPLLEKNGLLLVQPNHFVDGKNFIQTIVFHVESGESMVSLHEVITAKQNDPQAFLAAQTYARRGALQTMFNMSSLDDDGNYAAGRADKLEVQAKPVKPQRVETKAVEAPAPKVEEKPKAKFERVVAKPVETKQEPKPAQADTTQW